MYIKLNVRVPTGKLSIDMSQVYCSVGDQRQQIFYNLFLKNSP